MVMRFQSPLVYFENCQKNAFHVFLETMKNGYKYLVALTLLDNFQTFCFKNYPAKHRVTGQNHWLCIWLMHDFFKISTYNLNLNSTKSPSNTTQKQ